MERYELEDSLKEEIRARVLGEGFMKLVQTVRRRLEKYIEANEGFASLTIQFEVL